MPRRYYSRESPVERELERKLLQEANIEKLKGFLGEISEDLKREGVPVTPDCRIDMDSFSEVEGYSWEIIKEDKERIKALRAKWYLRDHPEKRVKKISLEEILEEDEAERLKSAGEQLEMVKTAVFHKFLREDFICVRSSLHDDVRRGIDNVILEKETGNIVCAFDEAVEEIRAKGLRGRISERRYGEHEKRKEDVLERNISGGRLKYGLKKEKGRLVLGKVERVPVFYLAASRDAIRKGMGGLIPSLEKVSEQERNLFDDFTFSIKKQLEFLKEEQLQLLKFKKPLNEEVKRRLDIFEKSVGKFKRR